MNRKVVKAAVVSRLFSLVVQCAFNNLVRDYDSSEEHCSLRYDLTGRTSTNVTRPASTLPNQVLSFFLGGNAKWDAVYFLDIAREGYQYEQNMAFFPLMPLLIHSLGRILRPLQMLFSLDNEMLLLLAVTIVNATAFILAALGLFNLTLDVFRSRKLAYKAALFFCYNPASVFFTAAYSESIFAMTQFWGMHLLEKNMLFPSAFLFSLGTATRSNGVVSIGFIFYKMLRVLYTKYTKKKDKFVITLTLNVVRMLVLLSIIILPFIAFQLYGFRLFCHLPQKSSQWCNQLLPFPYSYIQKHYWDVGFLRYFQWKQLPNFLLAMPAVIMCVWGIYGYLVQQTLMDVLALGFLKPLGHCGDRFVYVVHLAFLLVFGVTSMHVQVLTRFISSSSPMLYWFAATPQSQNIKSNFVVAYFLIYYWLGFLLHCNFYPWT